LPSPAVAAAVERFWCMETDGFRIYLDRRDSLVSAGIAVHGYEPHVTATLRLLLNPGSVFLDLGATSVTSPCWRRRSWEHTGGSSLLSRGPTMPLC
jgi:hypothetical protein